MSMTPKERAAMQQSLEALESCVEKFYAMKSTGVIGALPMQAVKAAQAITALREALAEQSEQKPVLCVECGQPTMHMGNKCYSCCQKATRGLEDALKAAVPVRTKDLTDDEKLELARSSVGKSRHWLVEAAIAADREKNK